MNTLKYLDDDNAPGLGHFVITAYHDDTEVCRRKGAYYLGKKEIYVPADHLGSGEWYYHVNDGNMDYGDMDVGPFPSEEVAVAYARYCILMYRDSSTAGHVVSITHREAE